MYISFRYGTYPTRVPRSGHRVSYVGGAAANGSPGCHCPPPAAPLLPAPAGSVRPSSPAAALPAPVSALRLPGDRLRHVWIKDADRKWPVPGGNAPNPGGGDLGPLLRGDGNDRSLSVYVSNVAAPNGSMLICRGTSVRNGWVGYHQSILSEGMGWVARL